ncbi:hypothetical protein Bca52824_033012 [Brassica carinata]|uniref:Cytosolic endo-beta-N-acetylglucosaminidase TIM barrel domain-containing protein n=1 Tax=Brassica carinata TaxID=52824 RepID=A0A8X7SDF9_BRACI|nr:hypothetical protein Bca52824_033012 [Brassica carinata]
MGASYQGMRMYRHPRDASVTLPPPCWTNTAHRHVVKVLGTFIKEWDEDKATCNEMLAAKESAQMYAERLVELSTCLGFDGWMINIENEIDEEQIPNLKEFESYPILSAEVAVDRKYDVYMGIDVFGRGSFGGGQLTVNTALDLLKRNNVSAAFSLQDGWWSLIEKSWGISRHIHKSCLFTQISIR